MNGYESIAFDRTFRAGEKFVWEGYQLTVDWMPGQTQFALCLQGMIDGRRVAFTGDNVFADPADRSATGHEAVVARTSGILEEGYIYAAEYLHRLKPDLLVGGHSWVMDQPRELIERLRHWGPAMRDAFRALSWDDDYRYTFDPYWVRAEPYRVTVARGQAADFCLCVRNFRERPQRHRIVLHTPPGVKAEPPIVEGMVEAQSTARIPVRLSAADVAEPGVHLVPLDMTIDGRRYGEWFDFILQIEADNGQK